MEEKHRRYNSYTQKMSKHDYNWAPLTQRLSKDVLITDNFRFVFEETKSKMNRREKSHDSRDFIDF